MAPAIRLAREGFALAVRGREGFAHDTDLAKFPESRRIFQRDGNYYKPGEIFKQPELAHTLERIAANPDDFYHGALARELAAAMQKGGGLITADDLAHYEVKERAADSRHLPRIRNHQRTAAVVGRHRADRDPEHSRRLRSGKPRTARPERVHLTIEAFRRAFFDRAEFLGDPDFSKIPVAQLIDKRYGAAWREHRSIRSTPAPARI